MSAELDALKLRVALLEQLFVGVFVSELSTTAARTRQDTVKLAVAQVIGYADAIRHQFPSEAGAFAIFESHVERLKSLIETRG